MPSITASTISIRATPISSSRGLSASFPAPDDTLEVRPLFPPEWDYLRLDRVIYRGREVGVVWDRDGSTYGLGAGLHLLADGA